MKIKEVKVRNHQNGNLLGFASLTFEEGIIFTNIMIKTGKFGRFITLPEHVGRDGEYYPDVYVTKEIKKMMEDAILKEYDQIA